jgi:ABC-type bacteriocin/lantibiotic exporter with double-glycine peptidase domain
MKVLKRLTAANMIWVITAFICLFLSIIIQFFWTIRIGMIADAIVSREKIELRFMLTMFAILLASCLFIYLKSLVGKYATERMAHMLRMDFACALLDEDTAETMGGYEAMSKAQNELTASSEGLSEIFDVIEQFLSGILALVFLLFANLRFTLIILGPMMAVVLFINRIGNNLPGLVNAAMDKKIGNNKTAYTIISNFEAVKVFGAEEFFAEKFKKELEEWGRLETKKERISAIANSVSGILSQLPLLILFGVGALLILNGYMTIGTLMIFLNMTGSFIRTITNLPSWVVRIKQFLVHLSRTDIQSQTQK